MTSGAFITRRPLPSAHQGRRERTVRVARTEPCTAVLGPGTRRGIWVQGCALRCDGCVVPESHPLDRGLTLDPEALALRLLDGPVVDGVTISGGEPFLQAIGLTETIRLLRAERPDWTFMSYSGYRLETLVRRGSPDQLAYLREIDILVDGPFVRRLAGSLLWRGSRNQRLLGLSARGARLLDGLEDRSAGFEISIGGSGSPVWTGVTPDGFRSRFEAALAGLGAVVEVLPESHVTPDERSPQ